MIGMSAITGEPIEGEAHLRQSVQDILTTPLGTRVGRRDYGSELPALVDAAWNGTTRLRLFAATAMALLRWEPRLRLTAVAVAGGAQPGAFVLTLDGQRTDLRSPGPTRLSVTIATPTAAS